MSDQMSIKSRVKIFVGTTTEGVEGLERTVNKWLDNNLLVEARGVHLATTNSASILTVWYSDSALNSYWRSTGASGTHAENGQGSNVAVG